MTPKPCDREILQNGISVFVTHTIDSEKIEKWVQKVAQLSGQRIDWHFVGGRAVVLALGNLDKVRDAIKQLMPELDELMKKAIDDLYNRLNMSYSHPESSGLFL